MDGSTAHDGPDAEPGLAHDAPTGAPDQDESGAAAGAPVEIIVLALVAAAIGIAFRFIARTPLWLDEALTVNIAKLPPDQITDALRQDGHPPLYYYLLHYWMQAFGTTDVAVRALSGVLSVVTLPVAYLVGRRKGGALLGWTFVAALSLSTFAVRYASETRMYSLVMLLVLVGYLLLDGIVWRGRSSWWRLVALGAVSGLLLLSHYWAMFLLAALCIMLLWRYWHGRNRDVRNAFLAIVVGAVVLFLPWLGVFRYQASHTGTPWASPSRPTAAFATALQDFQTVTSDFKDPILAVVAMVLLLCLGLFGAAVAKDRITLDLRTVRQMRYEGVVVALTMGLGVTAGLVTKSAFASRYAAVLFPIFLLIVAAGVTRFVGRPVRFGVLAVYLALSTLGVVQASLVFQRTQARVVAEAVNAANARPGDVVVYCPDQLGPAGQREMRGDLTQVSYPTLDAPERVDWRDYATRNETADSTAIAKRVLDMAGPDHSIFVVWAGSYRTFENKCEEFMHQLSVARPVIEDLVTGDPDKYYEHENLKVFRPSS